MEVFFNELSVQPASSDAEACQWIETLARLGQSLHSAVESLGNDGFTFRRSDNFGQLVIRPSQTILDFLQSKYDYGDAVYVFLLGIFDSPYITADDPQRDDYDYTSLKFNGVEYNATGLAATYLKQALAISFASDAVWDTCHVPVEIERLGEMTFETLTAQIDHASQLQHLVDCHLSRLSSLYDWRSYRPRFNFEAKVQTLLCLECLYCLHVPDGWNEFYRAISQRNEQERVSQIRTLAGQIAAIQRWVPATGSLRMRNTDRLIFTVPDSHFIVSVDTDHGEFEVHINQKGNNHLGAVSFDGKRFKPAVASRSLRL